MEDRTLPQEQSQKRFFQLILTAKSADDGCTGGTKQKVQYSKLEILLGNSYLQEQVQTSSRDIVLECYDRSSVAYESVLCNNLANFSPKYF